LEPLINSSLFVKLATEMIDLKKIPKTEFAAAVAQIAGERNIDADVVINSVEDAILAAFKRDAKEKGIEIDEEKEYEVELDPETGETKVYELKEEGEKEDVTPPGFGRIAAQTAKQVILQKIREAEKQAVISEFEDKIGSLIKGVILRREGPHLVVGIGKAEALMPKNEQVKSEKYPSSERMSFYIQGIDEINGKDRIVVSRADPQLVVELFKREVPEVNSGAVVIEKIARRPGQRTKIAVDSTQPGVDPVGSCVGQKGVRVQAVIQELNEEKVDVIPYSDNIDHFIEAALSPAKDVDVMEIDEENEKAVVEVAEDELAMAIGDGGENVRLAGELVGFEIKVEGKEVEEEPAAEKEAEPEEAGEEDVKEQPEEEKEVSEQPAEESSDGEEEQTEKKAEPKKTDKEEEPAEPEEEETVQAESEENETETEKINGEEEAQQELEQAVKEIEEKGINEEVDQVEQEIEEANKEETTADENKEESSE
jgi:N utilization substance protein A